MIEKLLKIVSPNSESLLAYYGLPLVFALVGIFLVWVFCWAFAQLMLLKEAKWRSPRYKNSYSRRFFMSQKLLIRKSITNFRRVAVGYIFVVLISHFLETFSLQLKESLSKTTNEMDKVWETIANYADKGSVFFEAFSSVLINTFFIILIAVWLLRVLEKMVDYAVQKSLRNQPENSRILAKKNTLSSVSNQLLRVIVSVLAVFTIMQNMGINIAALLATAGLATVTLGLGAQNLVKDFIGGFFILFEDQMAVGDNVEIGCSSGTFGGGVEKMTLRMVRLRSGEGSLVTIPNSDIRSVKNFTTDWSRMDFKIALKLNSNLEAASRIFQEEVDGLYKDFGPLIIAKPDVRPLDKIVDHDGNSVGASFKVFVKTTSPANKLKLEMEFNKRLLHRFQQENIQMV